MNVLMVKKKRCNICKNYFDIEMLDGRLNFYTSKYCGDLCRREAFKKIQKKRSQKQKEVLQKKHEDLKSLNGKVQKKCKFCKNTYITYISQIRARGSSFCSMECKNIYRKKNVTMAQLKKRLWNTFSKYIRMRDAIRTTGGVYFVKCITCDEEKNIKEVDAGHFFSRRHASILYDEKNVHAQCKRCNMPPLSGEQYIYSKKILYLYGEKELLRLEKEREEIKKYTRSELEKKELKYQKLVKDIINKYGSPWVNL